MGVDKTITYDLTALTSESAIELAEQFEDIIKKDTQQKKKKQTTKEKKEKDSKKAESKIKDVKTTDVIEELPIEQLGTQGGISFFVSQFKSALPLLTPILIASGFFISQLLKLDKLEKKFLDIADTRINSFINRQEQARLDEHLSQTIYTTSAGTSAPRDAYNSFNDYDRIIKRDGTERNASTIGGVD